MEDIGKRESVRRRLLELWGNVSAALARDGSVLLTDPNDVHLLDGTVAFLASPSSPSRERVEVLEEALTKALRLKGGWREAIVELEDFCSEPVRLRNMIAAADQLDEWAESTRAVLAGGKING